jgi:hypothetical protein
MVSELLIDDDAQDALKVFVGTKDIELAVSEVVACDALTDEDAHEDESDVDTTFKAKEAVRAKLAVALAVSTI